MPLRLIALFFALPLPLLAQYEKILNDPDVIWAAEVTLTFAVEPEFVAPLDETPYDEANFSVPLKLQNTGSEPFDETGILLAPRIIDLCRSAAMPVYETPEALKPLDEKNRSERFRAITGANDSITVIDPVTLKASNKAMESTIDPYKMHYVRVRQVLFYRSKADEFDVYTYAFAPLFQKSFESCADCITYYIPFWFRMPPYSPRSNARRPRLNDPKIRWARRLTTRENLPPLDSLKILKNFRPPVMQQWINRVRRDSRYELREGFAWQAFPQQERQNMLSKADTLVTFDPETYEEKTAVRRFELEGSKIMQLKLMQDWFWDDKRRQLITRLYAFAPLLDVADEDGNFRYKKPLCWRVRH